MIFRDKFESEFWRAVFFSAVERGYSKEKCVAFADFALQAIRDRTDAPVFWSPSGSPSLG